MSLMSTVRCISHPFDFKEAYHMKKEYDTVIEGIERVKGVFLTIYHTPLF